ncbi:SGNH/GDSL hydrolase family protein [Streptomyces sp. NPDC059788]|uniref:SGNH/GDSL hydrolase family protein n=1 Tax=Streptomyces sp. NPDC059788 TaxID=3346948 RepID=UPI0036552E91
MTQRWVVPLLGVVALALVGAFGWSVVFASDPMDTPSGPRTGVSPPAAGGGAPTPAPHTSAGHGAPEPRRRAVPALYLGDSLAMESGQALAERLGATGRAKLHSAPHSGTTLCDYLTAWRGRSLVPDRDKAATLVRTLRPRVVILQFWGNAWGYTPCMAGATHGTAGYYDRYAADARALTDEIAAAARAAGLARPKIVWASQAPDAFHPDRVRRVNAVYAAQAAASGDLYADAGRTLGPADDRYRWARQLPCDAYERAHPAYCTHPAPGGGTTDLHRVDDALHFCLAPTTTTPRACPVRSPGIGRFARAVAATVDGWLRGATG